MFTLSIAFESKAHTQITIFREAYDDYRMTAAIKLGYFIKKMDYNFMLEG